MTGADAIGYSVAAVFLSLAGIIAAAALWMVVMLFALLGAAYADSQKKEGKKP